MTPDTDSYEPNVVVLFRQTHRPVHYVPDHVHVIRERLNRRAMPSARALAFGRAAISVASRSIRTAVAIAFATILTFVLIVGAMLVTP